LHNINTSSFTIVYNETNIKNICSFTLDSDDLEFASSPSLGNFGVEREPPDEYLVLKKPLDFEGPNKVFILEIGNSSVSVMITMAVRDVNDNAVRLNYIFQYSQTHLVIRFIEVDTCCSL